MTGSPEAGAGSPLAEGTGAEGATGRLPPETSSPAAGGGSAPPVVTPAAGVEGSDAQAASSSSSPAAKAVAGLETENAVMSGSLGGGSPSENANKVNALHSGGPGAKLQARVARKDPPNRRTCRQDNSSHKFVS
jgi:hypothetical protein